MACVSAPVRAELQGLLEKIIVRLLRRLTRLGYLIEEEGMSYFVDMDADNALASLQAAACTYCIALGPRAGQEVLSLRTVAGQEEKNMTALCAVACSISAWNIARSAAAS